MAKVKDRVTCLLSLRVPLLPNTEVVLVEVSAGNSSQRSQHALYRFHQSTSTLGFDPIS